MERNWYWRIALVAGVLVLSVYQLLPSWYYFPLAPDKRSGPDGARIAVKSSDARRVEQTVLEHYGEELMSPAGAPPGTVWLAFRFKVIQDFQAKAVDQAEKTIRNRVDKWGVTEPDIKRKGNNQIQIQLPGFKDPEKAMELLGRTAQLEFKIAAHESPGRAA